MSHISDIEYSITVRNENDIGETFTVSMPQGLNADNEQVERNETYTATIGETSVTFSVSSEEDEAASVTMFNGGVSTEVLNVDDDSDVATLHILRMLKGEKGDKPVAGVDYWTDTDKAEFMSYLLSQVGTGWVFAYVTNTTLHFTTSGTQVYGETLVLAQSNNNQNQ